MRFWDTSALVALLADERGSAAARDALAADGAIAAWWATRVECVSAIRSGERAGALDARGVGQALDRLRELADAWFEVLPGDALRASAERALAVHPLRAADAMQLAAALAWRGPSGATGELVCFDGRLRDAAAREGFTVLPGSV